MSAAGWYTPWLWRLSRFVPRWLAGWLVKRWSARMPITLLVVLSARHHGATVVSLWVDKETRL